MNWSKDFGVGDLFFIVYTLILLENFKSCNVSLKLLKKKLLEKAQILHTSAVFLIAA